MEKAYPVKFYIDSSDMEGEYCHRVKGKEFGFYACDLCECPEDATLFRDLFNGYDYIEALETGMKLAQMGYTSLAVEYIENGEEADDEEDEED